VLQDENLFQIMAYDRMTNTPPQAAMSEPKRVIGGHHTNMEFNCGLYIDPKNGDIYSVNNDTLDTLVIFSREVRGDMPPTRQLSTPHRTYGIAVDEQAEEMFLTVQDPPHVVVYRKYAQGEEDPIRTLRGNKTQLADAHGIALDTKNGWMFVVNYGNAAKYRETPPGSQGQGNRGQGGGEGGFGGRIPGSGYFAPPSITVYPIKAEGDVAPLRTISGPKTQLNWPAHMHIDEAAGLLYIANDGGDSVLVFKATDNGDVAPTRVIKGPRTGIKNPTGVFVDNKNNEIVIANMGNHMATVYPLDANGDVAPKRVIRAAPPDQPALQIGNPGAVAYDTKREQILVPN
jgi:6-phosphogluconolactonase (cycloisomerase 2 family)